MLMHLFTSTLQSHEMKIRARLYASDRRPCQVLVPTWCKFPPRAVGPHFPYTESMLEDAKIQPYVHDCIMNMIEGAHTYRFHVFYKRHARLRANNHLPMTDGVSMRGSMFVMRVAALEPSSVVNMRGRDTVLADYFIGK